jgi:hypothetical protein
VTIEALPFVNWIFWTGLTSGTLLVVGVSERLGGTTRGYRLFMAAFITACAAILVLSELSLVNTAAVESTAGARRTLVFLFAGGCLAYLVASIARWPRSWLAIGVAILGLASLATLAVAGGTRSGTLFAGQLVIAALALGAVNAAMLLGHWYLVTPKLSPTPLRRMMWLVIAALAAQTVLTAASLATLGTDPLSGALGWLTALRLAAGIGLPIVITVLALLASRAASLQASTGLLYIGLALVIAGSIAGSSISYLTGVPV